jgi:hypothetical protein
MDVQRAITVLRTIRDDVNTPMSTAADIDQVLVELLDDHEDKNFASGKRPERQSEGKQ